MKICIIAPVVIPILGSRQEYGGIETVISIASEEMVKRGHEVIIFASGDSKTSAKLVATTPKSLGQGISFEKEKKCNRKAYEMAVLEKPDVIWDHTMAIHSHEICEDKSKFIFKIDFELKPENLVATGDIPIIHTLHGPAKDNTPKIIHALSEAGHFFVSISKDQASGFLPFIQKNHLLRVIYNPVNLEEFSPKTEKAGEFFFWVGRFCMEKGPHIAMEAAKKVKVPLKLAGKISEKHEIEYFKKFIKPRLGKYAQYLGMVSSGEKVSLFRNAKATLMTNIWAEPFGLVAAESLASGTPVVGPDFGSLSEVVGTAGVLVPVHDLKMSENDQSFTLGQKKYVERIVKGIGELGKVPRELPRLHAEKMFSTHNCTSEYINAFSSVTKKNPV